MRGSKSVYLRVNETEAILVEIYTVDPKCKKLQDRYVQEVMELLRDTVCTRVGQIQKKKELQKNQKESSGILTGTNVRVGYAFKNRPGNQTCLYSSSVLKCGKYSSDEDIDSLKVLPEKLLVYVQVLGGGSPKGMSQLLRRLSDVRHATGSGVSISSYFQKMSSSQRSQVQETSTKGPLSENDTQSQCSEAELLVNSDPVKINKEPPSEGRKHTIRNILKRGNFPGKKKKLKTGIETVTGMKSDMRVVADMKAETLESNSEGDGEEHNNDKACVESTTDSSKPIVSALMNEDDLPVNISRITDFKPATLTGFSPSTFTVNTDLNESQTFTVSKVSVQNLAEIQESEISCKTIDLKPDNQITCMDIINNRKPENTTDCDTVSNQNNRKDIMLVDWSGSQSDSSDNSPLPSASFCAVKSNKRLSQFNRDTLRDILNVVENKQEKRVPEQGSPKFIGKLGKRKDYLNDENFTRKTPTDSANSNDSVTKKRSTVKTLNRFRYKRKFPKFSDSDSEDSLHEKKRQTIVSVQTNKFAVTNNRKALCKKIQISKDFFSESKSTKQPKLSFFTDGKKIKKEKDNVSDNSTSKDDKFPDLDVELIQELSDFPKIKSEADIELLEEVKSLRGVEYLNEEQIRFLIRRNDTFLRHIFEGKVECSRHEAYKEGGKKRRDLSFASRLGPYSDEQIDIVMECLMSLFCKSHHKYLDYIMKVLLPEMLISFHMEIHNTSHEESERLLGPRTPEQLSSS